MAEAPTHLVVGYVARPHGTQGELYVHPLTDHPGSVFAPGVVLRTAGDDGPAPDPDFPPLRVEAVRPFRDGFLVRFAGVLTRNDAERVQGRDLVAPIERLEALGEGELFQHQLLGMRVVTADGQDVGLVQEIYEMDPADLLEVRGEGGTLMIPYSARIVVSVDAAAGLIVIDPPEGLLDL